MPEFIAEKVGRFAWWGSTTDNLYPYSIAKEVSLTKRGAIRAAKRAYAKQATKVRLAGHNVNVTKVYRP
jgi:hypothetical protein